MIIMSEEDLLCEVLMVVIDIVIAEVEVSMSEDFKADGISRCIHLALELNPVSPAVHASTKLSR